MPQLRQLWLQALKNRCFLGLWRWLADNSDSSHIWDKMAVAGAYRNMELEDLARKLGELLKQAQAMVVTAESCTGGWLSQTLTSIPGSSHWFERGFVTYTNAAKREMLDVNTDILARFGAASEKTARAMAEGALAHSQADYSLAITGIAGPSGGTPEKPIGTVCFAWSHRGGESTSATRHFSGDRQMVRQQAVAAALQGLLDFLD